MVSFPSIQNFRKKRMENKKEEKKEEKEKIQKEELLAPLLTSLQKQKNTTTNNNCLPLAHHSLHLLGEGWRKDKKLTKQGVELVNEVIKERVERAIKVEELYERGGGELPEVVRPVFIVGWIRTGSTFLHNLLSSSIPSLYAPPLWQLLHPFPPYNQKESIKKTTQEMEEFFSTYPKFRYIHNLEASLPDECCHLFECLGIDRQWVIMGEEMEEYRQWMLSLSKSQVVCMYKRYKVILQWMLWYEMEQRQQQQQQQQQQPFRLLLKDHLHMFFLDSLLEVFPDASLLCLSRSPLTVLSSSCSGWFLLSSLYYGEGEGEERDRRERWLCGKVLQSMVDSSSSLLAIQSSHLKKDQRKEQNSPFLNIQYEQMMKNPTFTLQKICEKIGVTLSLSNTNNALSFISAPKLHGKHYYSVEKWLRYVEEGKGKGEREEREGEVVLCEEIQEYVEFVSTHFQG